MAAMNMFLLPICFEVCTNIFFNRKEMTAKSCNIVICIMFALYIYYKSLCSLQIKSFRKILVDQKF